MWQGTLVFTGVQSVTGQQGIDWWHMWNQYGAVSDWALLDSVMCQVLLIYSVKLTNLRRLKLDLVANVRSVVFLWPYMNVYIFIRSNKITWSQALLLLWVLNAHLASVCCWHVAKYQLNETEVLECENISNCSPSFSLRWGTGTPLNLKDISHGWFSLVYF